MKQFISTQNTTVKLILGILLSIALAGILFIGGIIVGASLYDKGVTEFVNSVTELNASNAGITRYFLVLQSIAIFIVPSICIALLLRTKEQPFIQTEPVKHTIIYLVSAVAMIVALPFVNFLAEFNKILLDVSLGTDNWMAVSELQAKKLTESILNTIDLNILFVNIFVIAVIPALGEELFFRGTLQTILLKRIKNHHVGILITAILFSAMHFQFYGFIPRIVMGLFLGYLYYWFKNLWVPILVHFVNNAFAVILYYNVFNQRIPASVENIGSDPSSIGITFLSTALVLLATWFIAKRAGIRLVPKLTDHE